MMPPTKRSGAAGMLLLFSLALGGAGLAFDYSVGGDRFWLGAEPGGRALIGVAAVALAVGLAHLMRLLFARRREHDADPRA